MNDDARPPDGTTPESSLAGAMNVLATLHSSVLAELNSHENAKIAGHTAVAVYLSRAYASLFLDARTAEKMPPLDPQTLANLTSAYGAVTSDVAWHELAQIADHYGYSEAVEQFIAAAGGVVVDPRHRGSA